MFFYFTPPPLQRKILDEICRVVREERSKGPGCLVLCGSYTIGKEKVVEGWGRGCVVRLGAGGYVFEWFFIVIVVSEWNNYSQTPAIAHQEKCKIFASSNKRRILLKVLPEYKTLLTTSQLSTDLHMWAEIALWCWKPCVAIPVFASFSLKSKLKDQKHPTVTIWLSEGIYLRILLIKCFVQSVSNSLNHNIALEWNYQILTVY